MPDIWEEKKMKILAFGDLHEDYGYVEELEKKAECVDLIICAGDITVFGDNIHQAIEFLDKFGKKVLIVHGNHESESELRAICNKTKNVTYLHKKFFKYNDVVIVGYGGGGFAKEEHAFSEVKNMFSLLIKETKKSIFLTHAPPHLTKLDEMHKNYHVGIKTFRRFIESCQPTLAISGHIHETFKKIDKIGKTVLVNPGPGGAIIDI